MDSERPIEKLLRRFAKKQNDETLPPELHPATRRLLQGEVARRFGPPAPEKPGFWAQWRWQVVTAACVLVVVGIGVAVFRPESLTTRGSNEGYLALGVRETDQASFKERRAEPAAPAAPPAAVTIETAAAPAPNLHAAELAMAKSSANAPASEPVAKASRSVAIFSGDSFTHDLHTLNANNTAQFANATSMALKRSDSAGPAVLNRFRMEQDGDNLRVVDADGSSYSGSFRDTAGQREISASAEADQKAKTAGELQSKPQQFFFKVSGTNLTLKQVVVFTGRVVTETNSLLGIASYALKDAATQPQFPVLLNSTVTGSARIGGSNEVEINASPVAP